MKKRRNRHEDVPGILLEILELAFACILHIT